MPSPLLQVIKTIPPLSVIPLIPTNLLTLRPRPRALAPTRSSASAPSVQLQLESTPRRRCRRASRRTHRPRRRATALGFGGILCVPVRPLGILGRLFAEFVKAGFLFKSSVLLSHLSQSDVARHSPQSTLRPDKAHSHPHYTAGNSHTTTRHPAGMPARSDTASY